MAKLVDAPVLGTGRAICGGSSPLLGTKKIPRKGIFVCPGSKVRGTLREDLKRLPGTFECAKKVPTTCTDPVRIKIPLLHTKKIPERGFLCAEEVKSHKFPLNASSRGLGSYRTSIPFGQIGSLCSRSDSKAFRALRKSLPDFFLKAHCGHELSARVSVVTRPVYLLDRLVRSAPNLTQKLFEPYEKVSQTFS